MVDRYRSGEWPFSSCLSRFITLGLLGPTESVIQYLEELSGWSSHSQVAPHPCSVRSHIRDPAKAGLVNNPGPHFEDSTLSHRGVDHGQRHLP